MCLENSFDGKFKNIFLHTTHFSLIKLNIYIPNK